MTEKPRDTCSRPAHGHVILECPTAFELLEPGVRWSSRREVPSCKLWQN